MKGTVADWMSRSLVTVEPETRVADAERIAADSGICHLLVLDGEALVGVVCICDLASAPSRSRIIDHAHERVRRIPVFASIEDAGRTMREAGVSSLAVVSGSALVGILTSTDLERAGIPLAEENECASCRSHRHVRSGAGGVPICLECADRMKMRSQQDDIGTVD